MPQVDPVTSEFLAETLEHLDQVDRDLVALEQTPDDVEAMARVFRAMHTLKGTSGFLAFERLEQMSHAAESVLGEIRDGGRRVTADVIDGLLATVDAVRAQLASISATGGEVEIDIAALIARFGTTSTTGTQQAVPRPRLGEQLVQQGLLHEGQVVGAAFRQQMGDPRRLGEILVEDEGVDAAAIVHALDSATDATAVSDSAVRVGVAQLDALLPIIADLVEVRSRISGLAAEAPGGELSRWSQRLAAVTREAQEAVMRTRLQPISRVWNVVPRIARDVAAARGKLVTIEMSGGDTELDRAVLEAVRDPLTHLVRNAVDHGIEIPADRLRRGKPTTGTLTLRASHDAGHVVVELADDGAGIDVDRVVRTAVERGVLTEERARELSADQAMQLIFLPGLSTSATVTEVSGRGVGMDVVRANLERLGGAVDVSSELGVGTSFRLRIPLTLAVIQAVLVALGERWFAVPQASILHIAPATTDRIESVAGAELLRWQGSLLPVVDLMSLFGLPPQPVERQALLIVAAGERRFVLRVGDVVDSRDVVVKPLGPLLERLRLYSGATFVGDNDVALILDLDGIADRAGLSRLAMPLPGDADADEVSIAATSDERVLVVSVGPARVAVPMRLVHRLESVPATAVEQVGSTPVVQWRGQIIRLAFSHVLLGEASRPTGDRLQLVVVANGLRQVGLVVDRIEDVADDVSAITSEITAAGLEGAAVVAGAVAGVLDFRKAVLAADPEFFVAERSLA